jgi:alkaline phosphatase
MSMKTKAAPHAGISLGTLRRTLLAGSLAVTAMMLVVACNDDDSDSSSSNEVTTPVAEHKRAKNVIVMINDGAGWGTWDAAAYWQYGDREKTPYASFPVKYGMSTYPLNPSSIPTSNNESKVNYDKNLAWSSAAASETPWMVFAGYEYIAKNPTDSAAAATAMASGTKTYNNAMNYDNYGKPVEFITQIAKQQGRATGVLTSVPFSHATPAGFGAQNISRNNYGQIARQMLTSGDLDLVMGTGAPGYTVNGTPCDQVQAGEDERDCDEPTRWMDAAEWDAIQAGSLTPAGQTRPWKMIRSKQDFERLARGELSYDGPLFGVPEVGQTLQQARQASFTGKDASLPSGDAYVSTVPTLATMTEGALKHLGKNREGFFIMIEGGATDWSAHTSRCETQWRGTGYVPQTNCPVGPEHGRLIEETMDFNNAVQKVIDWVEKNSSWDETLLIVTTDHDNGTPMGLNADTTAPFDPLIVNNGKGVMPGFKFLPTGNHSNALVPLWAKGAGAEYFTDLVKDIDENFKRYARHGDGGYVDNTDIHAVVKAVLTGEPARSNIP